MGKSYHRAPTFSIKHVWYRGRNKNWLKNWRENNEMPVKLISPGKGGGVPSESQITHS